MKFDELLESYDPVEAEYIEAFGDCDPYMYVIRGRLYNPRTENLVYVSGTEHLKWFGDKFSIV